MSYPNKEFSGAFTPVSLSIKLPHTLLFIAVVFFLYILKKCLRNENTFRVLYVVT